MRRKKILSRHQYGWHILPVSTAVFVQVRILKKILDSGGTLSSLSPMAVHDAGRDVVFQGQAKTKSGARHAASVQALQYFGYI